MGQQSAEPPEHAPQHTDLQQHEQQHQPEAAEDREDGGLRLLKKGQKGIVHAIFSRFGLVLLLMLLQVGVLWGVFRWFGTLLPHYFGGSVAVSVFMVVYILNSRMDNSAKITWMVTIAILPVVGVPLFFYVKSNFGHNALQKRAASLTEEARGLQPQPLAAAEALEEADPGAASLARYLHGRGGGFPVYQNTEVTYFQLAQQLCELGFAAGEVGHGGVLVHRKAAAPPVQVLCQRRGKV